MKKIIKLFTCLFSLFLVTSTINLNNNKFEVCADTATKLGDCQVVNIETWNPFGNGNEFVFFYLSGTDYPEDTSHEKKNIADHSEIVNYSEVKFDGNSLSHVASEVHINFGGYYPCFVVCYATSGNADSITVNQGFKVPSYSFINGGSASYYEVSETAEFTRVTSTHSASSHDTWKSSKTEENEVNITKIQTFVDEPHEMLSFYLSGTNLDYPKTDGVGNFQIGVDKASVCLPNFTDKVKLYSSDESSVAVEIEFILAIDLWTIYPILSVGLKNLDKVTKIEISSGLILPSYAYQQGQAASPLYSGFTVLDDYSCVIQDNPQHTGHGVINSWTKIGEPSELGNVAISNFYTENPDGGNNEFVTLKFSTDTDFKGIGQKSIPNTAYKLFSNFEDKIKILDDKGQELDDAIQGAYFNYTEDNSVSLLINNGKNAVKVSLESGLIIPSYDYVSKKLTSASYGYYTLDTEYIFCIGDSPSHTAGSKNEWRAPICHIYYYNEKDELIEEYSTTAPCNSSYLVENIISKKGYDSKWVITEPAGLTIENGYIDLPKDECDVKLKCEFTVRTYKLTFEGLTDVINVTYGTKIGQLPEVTVVEGKDTYWMVDDTIITSETVWEFDENKEAVVYGEDKYLTVTFETNGGSNVDPVLVLYGTALEEIPTSTKEGYSFGGWYKDSTLTEEFNPDTLIKVDTTLYARWIVKFVVSFDSAGGSSIDAREVLAGNTIGELPTPTREGFAFKGWTLNGENVDKEMVVTSNITLVAKWEEINKKFDYTPVIIASCASVAGVALIVALVIVLKRKPWLK